MSDLTRFRPIVLAAAEWAAKDGPYTRFSARVVKLQPNGREVLCVAGGMDLDDGRPVDWWALFEADAGNERGGVKRSVARVLTREKLKALIRAHDSAGKTPGPRRSES